MSLIFDQQNVSREIDAWQFCGNSYEFNELISEKDTLETKEYRRASCQFSLNPVQKKKCNCHCNQPLWGHHIVNGIMVGFLVIPNAGQIIFHVFRSPILLDWMLHAQHWIFGKLLRFRSRHCKEQMTTSLQFRHSYPFVYISSRPWKIMFCWSVRSRQAENRGVNPTFQI